HIRIQRALCPPICSWSVPGRPYPFRCVVLSSSQRAVHLSLLLLLLSSACFWLLLPLPPPPPPPPSDASTSPRPLLDTARLSSSPRLSPASSPAAAAAAAPAPAPPQPRRVRSVATA